MLLDHVKFNVVRRTPGPCFTLKRSAVGENPLPVPPANEDYFQLLRINDSQPSGLDVSSYTIEEIDSITSEYTLQNNVSCVTPCLHAPSHSC